MAADGSDREQITDVLIRYATGIDTRDWPRELPLADHRVPRPRLLRRGGP
jgi:hypothetical protein